LINSIHDNFPDEAYEIIIVSSDEPGSDKINWLKNKKNTRLYINKPAVKIKVRINIHGSFLPL